MWVKHTELNYKTYLTQRGPERCLLQASYSTQQSSEWCLFQASKSNMDSCVTFHLLHLVAVTKQAFTVMCA